MLRSKSRLVQTHDVTICASSCWCKITISLATYNTLSIRSGDNSYFESGIVTCSRRAVLSISEIYWDFPT